MTAAFNPQTASTTGTAFLFPSTAGLILARVDYLTDRVLGGTNFEALATELNSGSASFLNRTRGALTARILSAEDHYPTGYQLTFSEKGSPPYSSAGTGTASAFSGLPYAVWDGQTITRNNTAYRLIRYGFPNVPLGNYEVTGPSGTNLLEGLHMNPDGVQVVPYDRHFNRLTAASKDVVMATSQTLASWETFTLEDYRLSEQYDAALGKLKAANGNYVVKDNQNRLVANSATVKASRLSGGRRMDLRRPSSIGVTSVSAAATYKSRAPRQPSRSLSSIRSPMAPNSRSRSLTRASSH